MHIGNYLKQIAKQNRYTASHIAQLVSKTENAVRKDFEKDMLHMSVLEAYGKALNVNIYEVLSKIWEGYKEDELENAVEEPQPSIRKKKDQHPPSEEITLSLKISGSKKDKILDILFK